MYQKLFFVQLIFVATIKGGDVQKNGYVSIIGGHDIPINYAPYMASILTSDTSYTHICGGTIIHERFILTAAHCFINDNSNSIYKVKVGIDKLNEGGDIYDVETKIIHKNFTRRTLESDIAIIKLGRSLTFGDKVQTIALTSGEEINAGASLETTGWGITEENGLQTSNILQQVSIPMIEIEMCKKIYEHISQYTGVYITPRMICAGRLGKSGCKGDSGGPLTLNNNVQVGITSFTHRCAVYPVIYTKISEMLPWILETIDRNF